MKRYTKQIEGVDVLFIKLGYHFGFFFEMNGNEHGNHVYVTREWEGYNEDQFKALEICALETIQKLNESNSTI